MQPNLRDNLLRRLGCPAQARVPLASLTTFRIGGPAEILAEPRSQSELIETLHVLRHEKIHWFYLGHGSNLLVSDEGFDGVVVRPGGELAHIEASDDTIVAGPAARLLGLTAVAASTGYSGMETLCGIPGSVGGGLYMNAGAYGGEICNTLLDVSVLTRENKIVTLRQSEIHFGYRSAPELQDKIILHSRYRLKPGHKPRIYAEMRRVWKLRRAKQPLEFPSAGSIFKRPPEDYAGRLIEEIGGKGMRVGGALVSPKHAGIFVNAGNATAADVSALVRDIRKRVYERFGILLEPEVKTIGFPEDPFAISL